MNEFKYIRAADRSEAVSQVSNNAQAKFLGGGTNLIDLIKENVEKPSVLVDVSRLQLKSIRKTNGGGVSIGATAKNSETANHPLIRENYPLLSQAILSGASQQIRNMATNGGNLLQRTRCFYFYDTAMRCNKREPGSGCDALEGLNNYSAVLGWNEKCVATHPSDMCVALSALDAVVKVVNKDGKERSIQFADFHRLPENIPEKDNNLNEGELITSIEIPKSNFAKNSYYLKVRDRTSYAFALVSVAAALEMNGQTIKQARIALGGVAHKPWRAFEAEKILANAKAGDAIFTKAAEAALKDAKALEHNAYKIELAKRAIVRALKKAVDGGIA
ncbi:MAG: xanthine dehydrogenase family protein subunit M [Actinomycetota bacterium]